MKKFWLYFVLFAVLITAGAGQTRVMANNSISTEVALGRTIKEVFPDPIFQKVIVNKLNSVADLGSNHSVDTVIEQKHIDKVTTISIVGGSSAKPDEPVIPNEFYDLESLEGIQYLTNLSSLTIDKTGMKEFPVQVFENVKLDVLSLLYNYDMDMGIEDKFDNLKVLRRLNLQSSGKNTDVPFVFPQSLYNIKTLTNVTLANTSSMNIGLGTIPESVKTGIFNYYQGDLKRLPSNALDFPAATLNFGVNKLTELSIEEYDFFELNDPENKIKRISNQYVIKNIDYDILGSKQVMSEGTIFATINEVMKNRGVKVNVSIAGLTNEIPLQYSDIYDEKTEKLYIPDILELGKSSITDKQLSVYIIIPLESSKDVGNGELRGSIFQFILNTQPISRNVIHKDIDTGEVLGSEILTGLPSTSTKYTAPDYLEYLPVDELVEMEVLFDTKDDIVINYRRKTYTVTVEIVDEDGNIISEDIVFEGTPGKDFDIDFPVIPGYTPTFDESDNKVTITGEDTVIRFEYKKNPQLPILPEETPELPNVKPIEPEDLPEIPVNPEIKPELPQVKPEVPASKPGKDDTAVLPSTGVSSTSTLAATLVMAGFALYFVSKLKKKFNN